MAFPIITLCGSLRAGKALWDQIAYDLSLEGYIVITIHVWKWKELHQGGMLEEKEMLDKMHRQRIDLADEVYIIDVVNGEKYIGNSTRGELEHAVSKGKTIHYHTESRRETKLRRENDGS